MNYEYDERNTNEKGSWKVFVASLVGAIIGALVVGIVLITFMTPAEVNSNPNPNSNQSGIGTINSGMDFSNGASIMTELLNYNPETYPVVGVVNNAGPSVVKVETTTSQLYYSFFGIPIESEGTGNGSGVIIDSQGYILTNNHVVENSKQINVVLSDGRSFPATVVGTDAYTDLAVLKIEADGLAVANLGDSDRLVVGELAIAIGNPYGFDHTVTSGVISALNRSLDKEDGSGIVMEGLIQTDAPINPGNSGGALLSASGQVVGINTAIISNAQNIGFAIPINTARYVAGEIISYGKVRRPYTGINNLVVINEQIASIYNMAVSHGVLPQSITRNSPATKAGITTRDIIVEVNGNSINSIQDLRTEVYSASIGDQISMKLVDMSTGKERTVNMILEETP